MDQAERDAGEGTEHHEIKKTGQDDGSDREQRDDARAAYEKNIGESSVQGSAAVWQRVCDWWGKAHQVNIGDAGKLAPDR